MKIVTLITDSASCGNHAWVHDMADQARDIESACVALGHTVERIHFRPYNEYDIKNNVTLFELLNEFRPDLVVNLVEGRPQEYLVANILEYLNIKYTGMGRDNLNNLNDKVMTKKLIGSKSIPVPEWISLKDRDNKITHHKYLVKPMREHNSIGLSDKSIVLVKDKEELLKKIEEATTRLGKVCFAEQFIEGNEYTVPILDGVVGLPVVYDYSSDTYLDRPKFMDYNAKWEGKVTEDEQSGAKVENGYDFRFLNSKEQPVGDALVKLAKDVWEHLDLKGYARLDFRADSDGNPYLLEVNVNPSITKTSAFVTSFARVGLTYNDIINIILKNGIL